jgi:hypothetical protein
VVACLDAAAGGGDAVCVLWGVAWREGAVTRARKDREGERV